MNRHYETYDSAIYPVRVVRTAIRYYASVCEIECQVKGDKAVCCFLVEDIYAQQVIHEFGNFLIELMQREGKIINDNT